MKNKEAKIIIQVTKLGDQFCSGIIEEMKNDILTEDEESERRQEEFKIKTAMFIDKLDVEDVIA